MNRTDLLSKHEKEIDNRITLVLTNHPALTRVWNFTKSTQTYAQISMLNCSLIFTTTSIAFRNAKTLKDHLLILKLKTTYEKPGVTISGRKNCETCHILHQGDTFESSNTGKQYKINFSFNYISRNVVYLLTCKVCEVCWFHCN